MLDLEKQYAIAEVLVGELGRDLVHVCYELVHEKLEEVTHKDTYFTKVMNIEVRHNGRFTRKYRMVHTNARLIDIDKTPEVSREPDHSPFYEYDPQKTTKLLNELRKEGFSEEVELFLMHTQGQTVTALNQKTGVCRRLIKECIVFVQQTVSQRYGDIDN